VPDATVMKNIQGIKLYRQGNQLGYPIIALNSGEVMELHFDDLMDVLKTIIILSNFVMLTGPL
jgi:hypothetical protein